MSTLFRILFSMFGAVFLVASLFALLVAAAGLVHWMIYTFGWFCVPIWLGFIFLFGFLADYFEN